MQFRIRTLEGDGRIVENFQEGATADEVYGRLCAAGRVVLSVRPVRTLCGLNARGRTREVQLVFCDQLRTLLGAGISVPESLLALRDSERDARFRAVLSDVMARIATGKSLSAALAGHPDYFPDILLSMLRSAEKTGALVDALSRYGKFQRQLDEFRDSLWAAATYPMILLAAGGCVIVFLLLYVVPRFSLVYRDMHGPLPWTARLLLAWGDFAAGRGDMLLALLAGVVALIGLVLYRPVWRQQLLARIEQMPGVGALFREIQLSHYFHSLSLLLAAGIALSRALTLSREILSTGMRQSADSVSESVSQGGRLSVSLEQNALVTPVALRLIQAGERSGELSAMLGEAAAFHDRRILHTTTMLARIAGPLLMAVMGLLIGGIVVLLYLPIFQLADGL